MVRDSQRAKVYTAEAATWYVDDSAHQFPSVRDAQLFVNQVTRSRFWRKLGGRTAVHLKPVNNRRDAVGRESQIEIPPWAMNMPVVLHELTHALSYRACWRAADHGPEFLLLYRHLITLFMGEDERRRFDTALETVGARWGIGILSQQKIAAGLGDST